MTVKTQASVLRRRQGFAVVGFWIAQLFLGVPSILTAAHLITTGKAEGALYTICLFLAWIGSTLAVGVGSLLHGKSDLDLPSIFKIEVHKPGEIPPE